MIQNLLIVGMLLLAQGETTFTVEYAGKEYETRISDAELHETPAWPPEQENPPLPARRAIEIARKQLTALFPSGDDWRLHTIALQPIGDRWIYLVEFLEPLRPDAARQLSSGFQIVVLMNGVAVTPKISP